MGEQSPGSGGAQASSVHAKEHPTRNQYSDKIKRQHRTHGVQGGCTGYGETKSKTPPPGTGRGLVCQSRLVGGAGAGVRMAEAGRERKGPLDGRTLGPTGT